MEKAKKVVYRAVRACQYDDGSHVKKMFQPGEIFPDDWKQGCPGWKNFRADDELMSRERKLKEQEAKLNA